MQNKNIKLIAISLLMFFSLTMANNKAIAFNESKAEGPTMRSQVAKILLSSLGGAVLGISTLSFYDRPQDHLNNVAIGGTLGAVLGSIYVTKQSLDYAESASLDEGGQWQIVALPQKALYGGSWSFSF